MSADPRGRGTSAWVRAIRERQFNHASDKLILMILTDYVNGDDECFPGNARLAPEVGVDERTVKRILARLTEAGIVERYRRSLPEERGRSVDGIRFIWEGFQKLPLVEYGQPKAPDKMSPSRQPAPPPQPADDHAKYGDEMSLGLGDEMSSENDSKGTSGDDQGDIWGTSSSFRTPSDPPKSKSVSDKPTRRQRRTPVPTPYVPSPAVLDWAAKNHPTIDPLTLVERFTDHHEAKGSLMASWDAAFRTWIGYAADFAARDKTKRNGHTPIPQGVDSLLKWDSETDMV